MSQVVSHDLTKLSTREVYQFLVSAVIPRPIAFVSSIDKQGVVNLSPFSYFNCFGANPPILVFSPSRRSRDNTTKHTYENVLEVPEVVISMVTYTMAEQMSITSADFEKGVNEFKKAGFEEEKSVKVKPPRVKESPVSFECAVIDVIKTGNKGGAGNLVVCKALYLHVDSSVLNEKGYIDAYKLDAIARLGGSGYARVTPESIFHISKPHEKESLGFENIPPDIRNSTILSGNDLGRLAGIKTLPGKTDLDEFKKTSHQQSSEVDKHKRAKSMIENGDIEMAWKILLS